MLTVVKDDQMDVGGSTSKTLSTAMLMSHVRHALRIDLVATREHQDPIAGLVATGERAGTRVEDMTDSVEGPQTVRLVGDLDLSVAGSVLRQLLEVLDRGDGPLVVDLADLTFINSSGLLVLKGASRYALERKRFISFVNFRRLAQQLSAFGAPVATRTL
jgi:anti-anti-sigma factor